MNKSTTNIVMGVAVMIILGLLVIILDSQVALGDAQTRVKLLRARSDLSLQLMRKGWIEKDAEDLKAYVGELKLQGFPVKSQGNNFLVGDVLFTTQEQEVIGVRYIR